MLFRSSLCVIAACAVAGCGADNGLTMGRVSGTVTFKGQPVEFGDILFVPDSEKGNTGVPSMGKIDKSGHYVMSTQESGDGVIAGAHKVGIRALDPTPVKQVAAAPEEKPAEDPAESSVGSMADRVNKRRALALEAKAATREKAKEKEASKTVSFNGVAYRFLASDKLANPETSGLRVVVARGSNKIDLAIQEDGTVKVAQ